MRILRESSKWVEKFRSVRSKSEKIVRIALHRNDNSRKNYDNFLRVLCKGFLHKWCESIVLVASTRALKWCRGIFKPITLFSRAMGIIFDFFSWLHEISSFHCECTELSVSAFKFLNECLLKRKPSSFPLPPEWITFMSTFGGWFGSSKGFDTERHLGYAICAEDDGANGFQNFVWMRNDVKKRNKIPASVRHIAISARRLRSFPLFL